MGTSHVGRQSVADQLFDRLLDAILSGERPAGSQLPAERELAVQAGVNRQAVREALQRLRQMDLVEIVHGGGVHVLDWRASAGLALLPVLLVRDGRAFDPAVARSIMELRTVIGADAARWCAERSPAGTGRVLAGIVDEMEATDGDPARWGDLGFRFWETVVVDADNIAYRLAFNTLRAVAAAVRPLLPSLLASEWVHLEDYRAVADAVAAGDGDAAGAASRVLLGRGVEAVNAAFSDPARLAAVEGPPER
ncbi:MAG TPA: GntR family transcriptional regulator [Aquihabitans sp.]|nr:GntR family transcriptional regulator [Aquihabitans sp.]